MGVRDFPMITRVAASTIMEGEAPLVNSGWAGVTPPGGVTPALVYEGEFYGLTAGGIVRVLPVGGGDTIVGDAEVSTGAVQPPIRLWYTVTTSFLFKKDR